MTLRRTVTTMLAAAALAAAPVGACTVAVVAGSATADGRPLLWKNRDSDFPDNQLLLVAGGPLPFLALVNGGDREGREVWAGVNQAGFCIMNSASYNLYPEEEGGDGAEPGRRRDEEGVLMRQALERCRTVADFARLLDETTGDRGVEANFGVIDASGGAAFFETTNEGFVRFDASDRRVAPDGHIVRTNYSFTGEPRRGAGHIRFDGASLLFHRAAATVGVDRDWLLQTASRDMVNAMTGEDPLSGELPAHAGAARYVYASDSLVRDAATATVLFQGVRAGDDPARTVLWARLGHPLCSVALPHWVAAGSAMPLSSSADGAPVALLAQRLLARVFPFAGTSRDRYLDLAPVSNRQGDGILPRLLAVEREVLSATDAALAADSSDVAAVQRTVAELARARLRTAFPEETAAAGW